MAIHKPYDRYFFLPPHAKLTDVGSLNLREGMFGIYDVSGQGQTEDGAVAVTDFKGLRKDEVRYEIRVGKPKQIPSRSVSEKDYSTPMFSVNQIIDLHASAPQKDKQSMDDVTIGYNGVDPNTTIDGSKGSIIVIELELEGRIFELLGYPEGIFRTKQAIDVENCPSRQMLQCEDCDPCEEVNMLPYVLDAIEQFKRQPMPGGYKLEDFVDITPIVKNTPDIEEPATKEARNFYCLEVCDAGDGVALAEVQAQFPSMTVTRTERNGLMSVYQVLKKGVAPSDYVQKLSSVIKGCEDCPDGYTEVEGGIIYAVSLADEGADLSTNVETLANAVAGTAVKLEGQAGGVGVYTVVVNKKLTMKDIKDFAKDNPDSEVSYVATTKGMCSNPTIKSVSWSACGSCNVATEEYVITMPDDECGESALEELQSVYRDLEIEDYGTPSGCQHSFKCTVVTNMVCDECDPIFKDFYKSEAPVPYKGRKWELLTPAQVLPADGKTLVGIRFRGKPFMISPDNGLMDKIAYEEDAVRIKVNGGYPAEQREAIDTYYEPLHVEYRSYWAPRTHVGGNLVPFEKQSYMYNTMYPMHEGYMERTFTNEHTRIDFMAQYVDFVVTIHPTRYAQGFGQEVYDNINFHFFVPYGAHEGVQEFMDMLAASVNLPPVKV